jgi:hypothetical protein
MKESGYHRNFERFLTGHMSARCLCQRCALGDLTNALVPVLFDLQIAHDSNVQREAKALVLAIIKPSHAGRIRVGKPFKRSGSGVVGDECGGT